ncbi:MAG: bifunctional 5,10-methylenetetrahydrofolate dehydrogenase/5,10-methenyltetrahydrofolate cyclohydrolase [bacterium]|nr:bifunctional 5,10-methylenetetrahydrofolate dehydrogenase/5,10-methenyltetrahydrofolate cyclohydrolase [bacterium]
MKLLEGKPLALEIKEELKKANAKKRLAIVMVGDNSASESFVALKEKFAKEVGIETKRYAFPKDISTNELRARMKDIVHEAKNNGVIVQLPLPEEIDTQSVLNAVTPQKDVDVLSARAVGDFQVGKSKIVPPVVGAVKLLFERNNISVRNKHVVVVGHGLLVGKPIAIWLKQGCARVTVMPDEDSFDSTMLGLADIIISGAGKPCLITGDLVKDGVVVVDVGMSEQNGKLVGDVDHESVALKAQCMTPEKGGVGPLTVAFVFKNLMTLAKK